MSITRLREVEAWALECLPQPARTQMMALVTAGAVALEWSWGLQSDEDLAAAILELEEALA